MKQHRVKMLKILWTDHARTGKISVSEICIHSCLDVEMYITESHS